MSFKFEKLTVWQKAVALSAKIHTVLQTFSDSERFVLTTQTQRAADSVALNIAEGSTGQTNGEFKQFLGYALRSTLEVVTCLYLARDRKLIKETTFHELYAETESLVRMLQAFITEISLMDLSVDRGPWTVDCR